MRDRLQPAALVRRVLLAPALAGGVALCLFIVLAVTGAPSAKELGPLGNNEDAAARDLVMKLSTDVEGTPTAADIRRAKVPLPERKRRLRAHPYFELYKAAKRRYEVSWFLVASIHYQETGFRRAKGKQSRAQDTRVRARDFNTVMRIAAQLRNRGAQNLGRRATRATTARYGKGADGRLSAAMVLERARAWKLLGVIPLPGSGELTMPAKGTIGGCGYFHCPRPGHLHNGVDFLAPSGTPIHAADAGRVALIEDSGRSGGYGNFVCLQHRPHLATCYAHLSAFAATLKVGHLVKRGAVIGLVGSTGSSTAPHLHFEVRRGAASCQACAVDPMPLLDGKVPQDSVPELLKLAP
jgi:murein DD-endopeptidase MepM/ murein hydrolase activator NlpD